jgi:hypothetical protein
MADNSFGHGIGIGHTYWPAERCANVVPLASTLFKTINDGCMQSIRRVTVELALFAWGIIPSATASAPATPIDLPSGVPMPFHRPPHYSKQ